MKGIFLCECLSEAQHMLNQGRVFHRDTDAIKTWLAISNMVAVLSVYAQLDQLSIVADAVIWPLALQIRTWTNLSRSQLFGVDLGQLEASCNRNHA